MPELSALLARESVEVAAVTLSKLPVSKAAEVLPRLPGAQARRITFAVSRTSRIAPEAVLRIGRALAEEYCSAPVPAFPEPAPARLGAILNNSAPTTREEVLGGLEAEDRDFAAEVRKAIFTFEHIPERVRPADIPRILRPLEPRTIAVAIASAQRASGKLAEAADFVLSSLPQRLAESIREEAAGIERIKPTDGEAAQSAIIASVHDRVAAGEVELAEDEEGDTKAA